MWFIMGNKGLKALMQFSRLEDFRVLMALLSRIDVGNLMVATQAELANELEMELPSVSGALDSLIEQKVILKAPIKSIEGGYWFNPNYGWKGSQTQHVQALDKFRNDGYQPTRVVKRRAPRKTQLES